MAGSILFEVTGHFELTQSFQPHYGPGARVPGIFVEGKGQSERKIDKLIAICEPIF
jgi:hypothetical protein